MSRSCTDQCYSDLHERKGLLDPDIGMAVLAVPEVLSVDTISDRMEGS